MVDVDVLQLFTSFEGNQYVVVFMDHFTKWLEVFAVADQKTEKIARFLVECVFLHHGVPEKLLSDRGPRRFLTAWYDQSQHFRVPSTGLVLLRAH